MSKSAAWKGHIESWEESGLSQSEFCLEKGLSLHCFKYWRCRFLKERKDSGPVKIVQIQPSPFIGKSSPPFFLRFQKWELSIAPNFDDKGLSRLLDVLEGR